MLHTYTYFICYDNILLSIGFFTISEEGQNKCLKWYNFIYLGYTIWPSIVTFWDFLLRFFDNYFKGHLLSHIYNIIKM